jgi:WD40-like Beta Propeller Repeat
VKHAVKWFGAAESHVRVVRHRTLLVTAAALLLCGAVIAGATGAPTFTDWTAPVNLGPTINTTFTDAGPAVSKDGLSLYFQSDRPGGSGAMDIWVSQRESVDDGWGTPVNLGPTVNSAAVDIFPAFSRDGHWMFFISARPGLGGNDIWASWRPQTHDDFGWQAPVNLGAGVNSASNELGVAYLENEGRAPQLYVTSDRSGGLGGFDLYKSELQADGTWGPLSPITELDSTANDDRPNISHNGLEIFFYSNRTGGSGLNDLWTATRDTVDAPWSTPVNLGPTVNSIAGDNQPYLSADAETLFFSSSRTGVGSGGIDLYMTTRAKAHSHG